MSGSIRIFELPIVLIGGFILDYLLGDPDFILHPVVIIGRLISAMEKLIRRHLPNNKNGELMGGVFLTIIVVSISTIIPFVLISILDKISFWLRLALEIFWCWQILAIRSLKKEALWVYDKVSLNDLDGARRQVGRIVGRDTTGLSMPEVIKACIETVAESTSDGVIAPLFFMIIGGVPLGFLYKAGNTLDSMVGYKNERYLYLGRASAKFDDILNYLPSRITALFMVLGARILGLDHKNALKIWLRDGRKHLSPNSGNPEAACAGALDLQLGGDAFYFGEK